ncbi:hypothetical protein MY5147_002045 [Beauveria neobassiana]
MYCGLLLHHMRSYAAAPGALVGSRRKTKDKVKVHSANQRNLKPLACFSLAVSHRLQRPGPRVPWSAATVQEELGLGYAHRYTDSRSHIKYEAKAMVEEAKLRYAALPPAGLVHEAWLFLERLQAGLIAGPGPGPGPAPPPRGYSNARRCCLLYRVCALPPPRASRSTTPKTVPTSDAPLRTTAVVLQKLVGEGHGRRMVDDSHREVEPERGVQALRQRLGPWHLDDKGRVGDERYDARGPAEGNEEIDMFIPLLKANMDMNGGGGGGSGGDLARLLQMLSSM